MRKTIGVTAVALLAWSVLSVSAMSAAAPGGEFIDTTVARFGYSLALPQGFTLAGTVSDTTTWTFVPELSAVPPGSADKTGGTLTIWINRMPVETMNLAGLYTVARGYDADSVNSPGAAIRDLRDLAVEGGYGYWYKEADKSEPAANHRWIAKVFGNGAVYTICVAGPFGDFEAWGPVFERVIVSFRPVSTKAE
jgi:hypothetical protein